MRFGGRLIRTRRSANNTSISLKANHDSLEGHVQLVHGIKFPPGQAPLQDSIAAEPPIRTEK